MTTDQECQAIASQGAHPEMCFNLQELVVTQPNKVIPIIENPGKAYIDPESIEVVVQILKDLKRKVSETEDLLEMMRLQQTTE